MREGDEHSPGCSTFFHGNCSVGWTLQQADPQEREERGNDLNGGKVEQRDRGKERAQAAREEELSEAREDVREGRKSAQIRQQDSEMAGERIKREKVVHSQVSVSLQGHFHICKCGAGSCSGAGAAVGALVCTPRYLGTALHLHLASQRGYPLSEESSGEFLSCHPIHCPGGWQTPSATSIPVGPLCHPLLLGQDTQTQNTFLKTREGMITMS